VNPSPACSKFLGGRLGAESKGIRKGYCDWRVPNTKELAGIIDYGSFAPSVDSAFYESAVGARAALCIASR